jgi:uncharacterized protein (DUF2147 family)
MQYHSFLTRLGAVLAISTLLGASARAEQSPQGWWLDATGKAGILIAPCGSQLCGKIEWLRQPLDSAGKPKTDIHNPDVSLRPRLVCGLTMLGNFVPDNSGGYTGGWIYDPSSGNTYKSNMHVADDGTLHVRGYVGVPLFGRSEIMTRPGTPLTPCAPG